ncbi:MAG: hypothetical protein O2816_13615 [Planctomycetota bacterium]|nr:hypothetical protein [Planctomycetota bacterium]
MELRWAPSAAAVQHDWVTGHQLYLDSFVRQVEGKRDVPPIRWLIRTERTLRAVDELRRSEDGRPLDLRRTYKKGLLVARMEPIDDPNQAAHDLELTTPLDGTSVVYTWVPSDGNYGKYYDALEGPEPALAELREDLDLRCLLPEGPVSVGQSWTVDAMDMHDVLEPGGQLALDCERGNRVLKRNLGTGMGHSLYHLFGGSSTGTITMQLTGVENGKASISMQLSGLRYLADVSEYVRTSELSRETLVGMQMTGGQLVISFEGTGNLVWDLAALRASSFQLTADETMEMTLHSEVFDEQLTERIRMVGMFRASYSSGPPGLDEAPEGPEEPKEPKEPKEPEEPK